MVKNTQRDDRYSNLVTLVSSNNVVTVGNSVFFAPLDTCLIFRVSFPSVQPYQLAFAAYIKSPASYAGSTCVSNLHKRELVPFSGSSNFHDDAACHLATECDKGIES